MTLRASILKCVKMFQGLCRIELIRVLSGIRHERINGVMEIANI
jgi:hypothetical protein